MRILMLLSWIGFMAGGAVAESIEKVESDPQQDEVTTPVDSFSGVGLAVIGDLDDSWAERVRSFAERNTGIAVRLRDVSAPSATGMGDIALELANERNPEDAAFVLLYAGAGDYSEHAVYQYDVLTAIVNVTLLRTDDEEQFLRRVEKLTMRSLGLLLDVPPVPNPQSAMWTYRTFEELDWMGRNFDPPSLRTIQKNAMDLGIPLVEESSFFKLR